MDPALISHVGPHLSIPTAATAGPVKCANIKSRKEPKKQCTNNATHGAYCGIHHKHPKPWSPDSIGERVRHRKAKKKGTIGVCPTALAKAATQIQRWFVLYHGLRAFRRYGPAYFCRELCTNDSDFFSTESVRDISGGYFISYKDPDNHVYGFDVRSAHTLIYRARTSGESAMNPFTRSVFPTFFLRSVNAQVRWLSARKLATEWAPLAPPTPEQQVRMKVVDLFNKIDELNYYSSPDWFLDLTQRGQRHLYSTLHDIWTHRAGLSMTQKAALVPNFQQRLFRHPPWAIRELPLETVQRLNMATIRMLITSASDRNDRILGAMYVVTALTAVNETARTAYPWLYESIAEEEEAPLPAQAGGANRRNGLIQALGIGWLNDLLALTNAAGAGAAAVAEPPVLQLPPPAQEDNSE